MQAPVPGKPIIANPGLNIANREINFIPRLDSVPESTMTTNLGINWVVNLTHLARTINSIIGGGGWGSVFQNKQNGGSSLLFPFIDPQIHVRKFQQREIDFDQLTDEEFRSRYRFDRESINYLVKILKDHLQRQKRRNHALSPTLQVLVALFSSRNHRPRNPRHIFLEAGGRKTR